MTARVLVVDDVEANVKLLEARLTAPDAASANHDRGRAGGRRQAAQGMGVNDYIVRPVDPNDLRVRLEANQ
jgi:CheY-like chemotaxis protein